MRKALKERILNGWKWSIEHSVYLWKATAEHIYYTIKNKSIKEAQQIFKKYRNKYKDMACSGYYERALKELEGKEYIKVDVGNSGKYMIDKEGNIFGIKAYGVIHKGHRFGNLDTINQYYWGGYRAVKKEKNI